MPNRILKDKIRTSADIDSLTWFEEAFYYRLIVTVDDFGCFDGRIRIINAALFPLKSIPDKQIDEVLNKLESVGMVRRYKVNGEPFLQILAWGNHQQIRSKKRKYPDPADADPPKSTSNGNQMKSDEINCNQMKSDVTVIQSNPIQSESNPNTNPNISTERSDDRPVPEVVFIFLPLNDGSLFPVNERDVEKYQGLYPAVDVEQELRNMLGWLEANPAKKKTKSGIKRFITGWLSRTQDKGGTAAKHSQTKQEGNSLGWGKLTSANDMWDEYEREQQQKGAAQ